MWATDGLALHLPGDPTALGWLTVIAYACAAGLCLAARHAARIDNDTTGFNWRSLFWSSLALMLVALGLNKQLDLQTLLIAWTRDISKRQGWYEHRRPAQIIAVVLVTIGWVVLMGCLTWLAHRAWRQYALALFGVGLLAGFVVLRMAYFEKMDDFVGVSLRASRGRWVLELGGIVCIGLAAWRCSRWPATARLDPCPP